VELTGFEAMRDVEEPTVRMNSASDGSDCSFRDYLTVNQDRLTLDSTGESRAGVQQASSSALKLDEIISRVAGLVEY
jgi:hypothetical protein